MLKIKIQIGVGHKLIAAVHDMDSEMEGVVIDCYSNPGYGHDDFIEWVKEKVKEHLKPGEEIVIEDTII